MSRRDIERFDIRALTDGQASSFERWHGIPRRSITRARREGAGLALADKIAVAAGRHLEELPRWNPENTEQPA